MAAVAVPFLLAIPTYFTLISIWPVSPGHYYYSTRLLIPNNKKLSHFLSWLIIWGFFFIAGLFILPYMVVAGANFLNSLVPAVSGEIFSAVLLIFSFSVVWFGIRIVGLVEKLLVFLMLLAIGAVFVSGVSHISMDNYTPFAPAGLATTISAFAILFSLGANQLSIIDLGGEMDQRTLKLSILGSGFFNLSTAVLITFVVVGSVSYTQLGGKTLFFVAGQNLSSRMLFITGLGALLAGVTSIIGLAPIVNRFFMAAADDQIIPTWLAKENSHGEPMYFIIILTITSLLTVFLEVPLATVASGFAIAFAALILLMILVGVSISFKQTEIFNHENLEDSRLLTPSVVRWSSVGGVIFVGTALFNLIRLNIQSFYIYLGILAAGAALYAIRAVVIGSENMIQKTTIEDEIKYQAPSDA